jgi:hypothetical protein
MNISTLRPGHLIALGAVVLGVVALAWAPWSAQARAGNAAPRASTVAMNCARGQQALVRQSAAGSELTVSIECAGGPLTAPAASRSEFDPPYATATQPVEVVPAVYRPAPAPVQTYVPRATPQPRTTTVRRVEPKRDDWKRDALIIGGSSGAGAGIGGLIGGKKGALIGAAIGGGGSALWRATKH